MSNIYIFVCLLVYCHLMDLGRVGDESGRLSRLGSGWVNFNNVCNLNFTPDPVLDQDF